MKQFSYFFVLMVIFSACRKDYTYTCTTPEIVLLPMGFEAGEWDTIITRVYNPAFQLPVVTDTFFAEDVEDVLLITPYIDDEKDFEIYVPAIDKAYRLYGISINSRSKQVREGEEVACYHDISMYLDGVPYSFTNTNLPVLQLAR